MGDLGDFIFDRGAKAAYLSLDPAIFELVVRALAERTRSLQTLAERHLLVFIRDELNLPTHGVMFSYAAQLYSKLQTFGIKIDPRLEVSLPLFIVYDCIGHD